MGAVVSATSVPLVTLKNWADLIPTMGATCQWLARIRSARLENFGVVATKLRFNSCRKSELKQFPRYLLRFPGTEGEAVALVWDSNTSLMQCAHVYLTSRLMP